jgi:hypothetical protein
MEEFGERKSSKLSNHVEDNMTKEGVDKYLSFNLKLKNQWQPMIFPSWIKILQIKTRKT